MLQCTVPLALVGSQRIRFAYSIAVGFEKIMKQKMRTRSTIAFESRREFISGVAVVVVVAVWFFFLLILINKVEK